MCALHHDYAIDGEGLSRRAPRRRTAGATPAACLAVLQQYGIANITSASQEWWTDRDTFTLLLQDGETGEPMGGVRLQRWGSGVPLPIECALEGVDSARAPGSPASPRAGSASSAVCGARRGSAVSVWAHA